MVLRPVFNRLSFCVVGLVLTVLERLMSVVLPLLLLVFFSVLLAFMFLGALQVAALATTRPFLEPLVQRYLRTVWPLVPLPLPCPNTVVTPSQRSRNRIIFP